MSIFFDLQLFAAGAGAGTGGSGTAGTGTGAEGGSGEAAPQQQTPMAETTVAGSQTSDAADSGESFESLIKGRYKAEYDAKVQSTIQDRLKGSKDREAKVAPILQNLAERYGVDVNDPDAIMKALDGDNKQYEQEALMKGLPVETVKKIHRLEAREAAKKAEAQRAAQEQAEAQKQAETQQHFAGLQQQAEQMKQMYPGFDLDRELQNPQFVKLTAPGMGIDVRTAYEAIHRDELRGQEMQYATQRTASRISASIQANARRPSENGVRGSVASTGTTNPANMSKQYRDSLIERARRGERILFEEM